MICQPCHFWLALSIGIIIGIAITVCVIGTAEIIINHIHHKRLIR